MAASSAPGTLYSLLAGMIMPAMAWRSSRWAGVRIASRDITASIEQIGQTLLHLVGDIERNGLDRRGRIDAARGDEHAAIDDEQVFHVMRPSPFVDHRTCGVGAHARGAEQMPAAVQNGLVDADVGRAGGGQKLPGAR